MPTARRPTIRVRAVVVTMLGIGALGGCGSSGSSQGAPAVGRPRAPAAEAVDVQPLEECRVILVPAAEVVVVGTVTTAEREMAEWALGRFALAGLELPSTIEIGFDPTRVRCAGARGLCFAGAEPPAAIVCDRDGETMFRVLNRRITLLHELAHIWHAAGPDRAAVAIVGGIDGGEEVPWQRRTSERVATVISWGLLDQPRRPVMTDVPCVDLYRQFEALTGSDPVGPMEPICVPAADTAS